MKSLTRSRLKILLAPLDWGLGHATRCIPIIRTLIKQGHIVFLAGDDKIEALLRQEFPDLPFLALKGYSVHYTKAKWRLPLTLLFQLPKILRTIKYEHGWLDHVIRENAIDVVISDNRYGLYHPRVHSVFITHQLQIKTPYKWSDKQIRRIHYYLINRFAECWVPDQEETPFLAGELAHPTELPHIPTEYIGPLSRFDHHECTHENNHLLILLSGPEPQRSLLEQKILKQLRGYKEPVILLRGLPGAIDVPFTTPNILIKNHLPADQLAELIKNAFLVISRCGYSTVMDLMTLHKRCILIPTPGQTEQEYLARYLMQQQLALCIEQGQFQLQPALSLASSFSFKSVNFNKDGQKLDRVIEKLPAKMNVEKLINKQAL